MKSLSGGAFVYFEGLPILYFNAVPRVRLSHFYVRVHTDIFSPEQQPLVLSGREFGLDSNDPSFICD